MKWMVKWTNFLKLLGPREKWRRLLPGNAIGREVLCKWRVRFWWQNLVLYGVPGFPESCHLSVSVSSFCAVFNRRWPETHHEAETLGPFWGSSGEVWVVSGRGRWLHGFLTAHVGAGPREESHCRWLSPPPLAQLLSPSPALQQRSRADPPAHCPAPPSISPSLFRVKLFLQGFLGGFLFLFFNLTCSFGFAYLTLWRSPHSHWAS